MAFCRFRIRLCLSTGSFSIFAIYTPATAFCFAACFRFGICIFLRIRNCPLAGCVAVFIFFRQVCSAGFLGTLFALPFHCAVKLPFSVCDPICSGNIRIIELLGTLRSFAFVIILIKSPFSFCRCCNFAAFSVFCLVAFCFLRQIHFCQRQRTLCACTVKFPFAICHLVFCRNICVCKFLGTLCACAFIIILIKAPFSVCDLIFCGNICILKLMRTLYTCAFGILFIFFIKSPFSFGGCYDFICFAAFCFISGGLFRQIDFHMFLGTLYTCPIKLPFSVRHQICRRDIIRKGFLGTLSTYTLKVIFVKCPLSQFRNIINAFYRPDRLLLFIAFHLTSVKFPYRAIGTGVDRDRHFCHFTVTNDDGFCQQSTFFRIQFTKGFAHDRTAGKYKRSFGFPKIIWKW